MQTVAMLRSLSGSVSGVGNEATSGVAQLHTGDFETCARLGARAMIKLDKYRIVTGVRLFSILF